MVVLVYHSRAAGQIRSRLSDIFFSSDLTGYRQEWSGYILVEIGNSGFKLEMAV
jgi:hypothetical protein